MSMVSASGLSLGTAMYMCWPGQSGSSVCELFIPYVFCAFGNTTNSSYMRCIYTADAIVVVVFVLLAVTADVSATILDGSRHASKQTSRQAYVHTLNHSQIEARK